MDGRIMSLSPKAFDSILATGDIKRSLQPRPDPLFGVQSLELVPPVEYESLDAAMAALQRARESADPKMLARKQAG